MIEGINWEAFNNQAVYDRPAHSWPKIELGMPQFVKTALHYPLATKLKGAVTDSATHWLSNTNPLNLGKHDLAWKVGFGTGVLESIAIMAFTPGVGLEQGVNNMLETQIGFFGIDRLGSRLKSAANIANGIAAGAAYASLPVGLIKVAMTPFDPTKL